MRRITHIVVHYTATYEDQDITIADVRRMHLAEGFRDVGYHLFIRRDGTLEKGRPLEAVGAHCRGHNETTIGVAWAGGLNRKSGPTKGVDNRTPAQTATLTKILAALTTQFPHAQVVGHRDLVPTQCPGFDVGPWWISVLHSLNNDYDSAAKVEDAYAPRLVAVLTALKTATDLVTELQREIDT